MRDTIADIITDAEDYGEHPETTANAIITAMPGMIAPLVWTKTVIKPSGSARNGDGGGWTMTHETPLGTITIDFHEQYERKGVNYPYFSNIAGGFYDEAEAIKTTETSYVDAIMATFNPNKST
jgi:hypothetical protein